MKTVFGLRGASMERVYKVLRRQVLSMHPGVPLPPVSQMMRDLSASQLTIDKAYGILEEQGLLIRMRGKGVFAADPMKSAGEIAIVMSGILIESVASPVFGIICSRLGGHLQDINARWKVKLHLGAGNVPGPELPGTLDLLDPSVLPRLRGVLSFHPLYGLDSRLADANVPVVYLCRTDTPINSAVFFDYRPIFSEGLRHLAEAGCRNVCLMEGRFPPASDYSRNEHAEKSALAAATAAEHGIILRHDVHLQDNGIWKEQDGYDLFMRMWNSVSDRPDGLLLADDVLCRGVLRACLQLGIEFPGDLRLITHSNRGVDLPYHHPVSRMEFDLDGLADKAVRMLESRICGAAPERALEELKPRWIKGETA